MHSDPLREDSGTIIRGQVVNVGSYPHIACNFLVSDYIPTLMIDPVEMGRKIRERRDALRLSRRVVAADAGVSESYIDKLERGKFRASLEVLRRLAARLEMPMPDLIGEPDPVADNVDLGTLALVLNASMQFMFGRRVSDEGQATWELAASLYAYVREEARQGRLIADVDQLVNHMRRMQNLPLTRR